MRNRSLYIVSLLLLAAILVAIFISCGGPAPTPEPAPSETPAAVAEPTDTPLPPTPAPPTATPPPLAPRVVEISPARGEELAAGQAVEITFDHALDAGSTDLSVEPDLAGEVTVAGNQVRFQPASLAAGKRYVLQLNATAADSGLSSGPLRFPILAQGNLEVTNTTPADGNERVAVDTPISVVFNRPVVPLTRAGADASLPQPLSLEPAVAGSGQWLNTSIYLFQPDEPLQGGTSYSGTVAGLSDLSGATLAEPYIFGFTTELPVVTNVAPAGDLAPPTTAISITFSQPMDPAATEAATTVRVIGGRTLTGQASWSDGGRTLVYQPDQPLPFGERVQIDVTTDARGRGGDAALRSARQAVFTVVPYPGVKKTTPRNGQLEVDVDGSVAIQFTAPILEETLQLSISPEISATQVYTWYGEYDYMFNVNFPRQPQTAYTVTLAAGVSDPYGNRIEEPITVGFRTGDRQPFLNMLTPGTVGTYSAYTDTVILFNHVNINDINLALYRLTPTQFANLRPDEDWEAWRRFTPPADQLLRQWAVQPGAPRNEISLTRERLTDGEGNTLPAGLYFLSASSPQVRYQQYDIRPRALLVVTHYNVVLKRGVEDALVWVTDLANGQPVPDAAVALYQYDRGMAASGRTGAEGVFTAALPPLEEPWRPTQAFVGTGDDPGWASTQWQAGISPWEFNLPAEYYQQPYRIHLYTERPLYRAGDTVYFRGILRGDSSDDFSLPQGLEVEVRLRNPRGDVIYDEQLATDVFGAVHGSVDLAAETELGIYSLELQASENTSTWANFMVAAFRKPEYELSASVSPAEVIATEPAQASMEASYFFGGPVKDAAVRWNIYSGGYSLPYNDGQPWSFDDFNPDAFYQPYQPSFSTPIASGTGQTNDRGQFSLDVPTELSAESAGGRVGSGQRTIEFTVTDANDQEVSGVTSLVVHASAVYPGVRPERYVGEAGQEQTAHVIAVDALDKSPLPGQEIEIEISRLTWRTVRERGAGGRLSYSSQVEETPVLSEQVTTGEDGTGQLVWSAAEPGQYLIRATARDDLGNELRSAAFTYLSGSGYAPWRVSNDDRLELVADRESYEVGDIARVLVPSPFQGEAIALVTTERRGILGHELHTFRSNSETLEIPILPEYAPNIFLSVVLVSPPLAGESPTFKVGLLQLNVDVGQHLLDLQISADPDSAGPGDNVTFKIRASDYEGKPVRSQVSLALVDKALLSLRPDSGPALRDTFWSRRGLGVQTGVSLVVSLNRIDEAQSKGTKGGGGGDGFAELAEIDVRTDFRDLAFWQADVETGANGEAQVTVSLPDNLTTWQMKAVAITQDTAVGERTHDLLVTKPLIIRPVLPRFVVHGDRFSLGVIVQNNSDAGQNVDLQVEELAGLSRVEGAESRYALDIPAGGLVRIDIPVQVDDLDPTTRLLRDEVVVRLAALTGDIRISDRIELRLPVRRYSSPETVATAGTVSGEEPRFEAISLPDRYDPTQGELSLRLEPSLAAGMTAGLDYLEHFEYECTEQTVSRFLPNILTARALTALGLEDPDLAANLDAQVGVALQRLYTRQNADGGWGWFSQEKSSPYTSAYVLFGLTAARESGYGVDEQVLNRGAAFLRRQLRTPGDLEGYKLNQQAFFVYVLDRYAQTTEEDRPLADAQLLFEERERMALYAQGYLALALQAQAAASDTASQAQILLDDLAGRAILTATGAHWEEGTIDWWTMNTDTRTTSIILTALTAIEPDHPLGPNVVRWLMSARTADRWESTHETAWALISLTDWLVASGELQADYDWLAAFNGQELGSGHISPAGVTQAQTLRVAVGDMLADQLNILRLERSSGPGQLYYAAYLRTYLPVPDLKPVSRGLTVARRYSAALLPGEEGTGNGERPAITSAQIGDVIDVELTLVVPTTMHYLLVEDPIPAGTEPIDTSFATTSRQYAGPTFENAEVENQPIWWRWWWNPTSFELKDDKVALFATDLAPGTYTFRYQLRASIAGEFNVLPPRGEMMYFPEVFGHGAGSTFTVTRP